jgi:kanamycin kinase
MPCVTDADFSHLAAQHTMQGQAVPAIARQLAGDHEPELVWRNDLGGLTFRLGDRYLKWNPRSTGIDLDRERVRLAWISARHPAPRVLDHGADDEAVWLLTQALPGSPAVGDAWRARRPEAIRAMAAGLRALHAIPVHDFPDGWTEQVWVGRRPASLGAAPPVDDPVVVHGDACAPNTLIDADGSWTGNVDFGDLAVGDRWAAARATRRSCSRPTASRRTRRASATTGRCGSWNRDHQGRTGQVLTRPPPTVVLDAPDRTWRHPWPRSCCSTTPRGSRPV